MPTIKQSPGVLLVQGEQFSGSSPDLGQAVLHSPHLASCYHVIIFIYSLVLSVLHLSLVPQPELSDELELLVQPSLLERSPGGGVGLPKVLGNLPVDHLVLSVAHLCKHSEW